ncbi:MAG TPA: type II secretion system protein [Candidatus Stercorousia faecigallinarum]|nr:type II secretion system protein [Candidatus Stercorousia faecigallinarum]
MKLCHAGGGRNLSSTHAFTLAEVLVTLGIIGVVSAMTVPSLMQNHQRKTYVTQLHKVYNELSQALELYQTDRNALNLKEAGLVNANNLDNFVKDYFKIVQECDTMDNCFADEYKAMNGNVMSSAMYNRNVKSYVLADGAALRPGFVQDGERILNIAVDINGKKGPNISGRDIFWLMVYVNGVIDDYGSSAPLTASTRQSLYDKYCTTGFDFYGCFGKILNDNWEMNY